MTKISGLTSTPIQTFRSNIGDGTQATFTLKYQASSQMFFLDVTYDEFTARGLRVCNNLNLLCQFQNRIPFGLFVECPDETEPFLINDFSAGRCSLNILTAAEVEALEDSIEGAAG